MEEVMSFRISLQGEICYSGDQLFDIQEVYFSVVLIIT